jgi:hypothetical protein
MDGIAIGRRTGHAVARRHGCPMAATAQSADKSSIVIPMVRCRPLGLPQNVSAAITQADGAKYSTAAFTPA